MGYTLKKEYKNSQNYSIRKPLKELTQSEISKLPERLKDLYFIKDTPKKKVKKDDTIVT